jgi:hypothetical protein
VESGGPLVTGPFEGSRDLRPGEVHQVSETFEHEVEAVWLATSWATKLTQGLIEAGSLEHLQTTVRLLISAALANTLGAICMELRLSDEAISVTLEAAGPVFIEAAGELDEWLERQPDLLSAHVTRWGSAIQPEGHGLAIWAEIARATPSPALGRIKL